MAADEEVEGLGRVLTRLALTEDDRLEQVCRLPPLPLGRPPACAPACHRQRRRLYLGAHHPVTQAER